MSDILTSFYFLAKHNNGMFKSEKQASFLLSKCEDNVFYVKCTAVFGESSFSRHGYGVTITCDDKGILSITKEAEKSGKVSTTFTRQSNFVFFDKGAYAADLKKAYSLVSFLDIATEKRCRKYSRLARKGLLIEELAETLCCIAEAREEAAKQALQALIELH